MNNHDFKGLLNDASIHANSCYEVVNRICHPLFKNTPISYFDYGRYYDSGEAIVLSSNADFATAGFEKALFPSFEEYNLMHMSGLKTVFLSHAMPLPLPPGIDGYTAEKYTEIVDLSAVLKIFHRIYFIERQSDHYQVSGFGSYESDISLINYFINSVPSLINFIQYFKQNEADWVESFSHQYKIIIPNYLESRLLVDGIILPNQLPLNFIDDQKVLAQPLPHVTSREKECLSFIAQGYSMKSVAQKLNISHRTVEMHMRNIKERHGVSTKNQLIEMWHEILKPLA